MELYEEIAGGLAAHNRRNGTRTGDGDVRAAVVALRASQFIYEGRSPGHFALLRSMRSSLEPHFELMGSRIVFNDDEGYVGLLPVEDGSRLTLTVEETLMLLTLRWIYESKVELRQVETDGTVQVDEAGLQQWYETNTKRVWPRRTARASLDLLERRSVVVSSPGEGEDRIYLIRGLVRVVTGSAWTSQLLGFAEVTAARGRPSAAAQSGDDEQGPPADEAVIEGEVE